MSLEERMQNDLKEAMKSKDADLLSVLRMLKTAITNKKIAAKTEQLAEEQILEIIQKQAKQRLESIDGFEKAGRNELAAKEKKEYEILLRYLPAQLSDAEIRALAEESVRATGAVAKADMGKVMKDLMPKLKGKADGKKVNQILSEILQG